MKTNDNQKQKLQEPHATLGDMFTLCIVLGLGVFLMVRCIKIDKVHRQEKQKVMRIDSLVRDSLPKTVEYQNMIRATQELESKKTKLNEYFGNMVNAHN